MSLASWLSTAYCFSNLFFLGAAQRGVGKVCRHNLWRDQDFDITQTPPSPRLHSALLLLLIVCLLTTFPVLPFLLPHLASTTPNFLLPLLIILTLLLALSTAYLQSAVFALASLWGSPEVIGVMSGQGGIAVLVSGTQIILAIISTVRPTGIDDGVEQGGQSTLASVGLWALCAAGAFGCMIAHRRLVSHPNYSIVLAPVFARRDHVDMAGEGREAGMGVTKRVLRKNWMLESAVAWVFIVTLVGPSLPCTAAIAG